MASARTWKKPARRSRKRPTNPKIGAGEPALPAPSTTMKPIPPKRSGESGKVGWMALLWLIGIPLPIVLLIYVLTGC